MVVILHYGLLVLELGMFKVFFCHLVFYDTAGHTLGLLGGFPVFMNRSKDNGKKRKNIYSPSSHRCSGMVGRGGISVSRSPSVIVREPAAR